MRVRIYSTSNAAHGTTAWVDQIKDDEFIRVELRNQHDVAMIEEHNGHPYIPTYKHFDFEEFVDFCDDHLVGNTDHTYSTDDPKIISLFLLKYS